MWNRTKSAFSGKISVIAFVCLISASGFSQNITNTLGASGVFYIKDATTNYFTLTQSTGEVNILKSLRLENTTSSTTGVIFKGADRFIHNYGTNNTFMGINSGNFTMTGGYNIAMGGQSLLSNTTGNSNAALGNGSLYSNTTGTENTAVGISSLYSNTEGYNNIAIGNGSLFSNTTGTENTASGYMSLYYNTIGTKNTASGYQSLLFNTTGYQNTASGYQSLLFNTTGYQNTASGTLALYTNTTGSLNTGLGWGAGSTITTGSNLTCLGSDAQPTSGDATNQITLGNGIITSLRCNITTITSLSDARDKKNIKDLNLGIDFLMKIKPRLFNWDKREWYENNISNGSKMKEEPTAGFIAQELDEAQKTGNAEWLNLVLKDNPEKWEATPGNLLPIVVKAIQDLKKENDELIVANNKLKATTVELTDRLTNFEQIQNMLVNEIEKLKTNNNESVKVSLGEK